MKELSRKTFMTIFIILSSFLILALVSFNIQCYKREEESIRRNLNIIKESKVPNLPSDGESQDNPPDIDNMMIMDFEVYTVILNDNNIDKIISHGNKTNSFKVQDIAKNILQNNNYDTIKIGNLYTSKYAYNYKVNETMVIVNTQDINKQLNMLVHYSLIILIVAEFLIYVISKRITKWLVKPALNSLKGQKDFIADASHELKTPLAVIIASADELEVSKKNKKLIENIKYESERMNNLIKRMLDLSKLENGVSKNIYEKENISKIVEKVCLSFEAIAFEEEVRIITDIEENIIFKCSKEEIERLSAIILDNAIKHSYQKSVISVNMRKFKNNINIEIINSGDPIKKDDEEKIFERFYRADESRSRKDNRYGLGLAIAKNIVVNHNGIIKAYSKNNKTTFKIIFKS